MRKKINNYIGKEYDISPEYPWPKYNGHAVYRHKDNKTWFALIMDVGRDKLGLSGTKTVSVINIKIDDIFLRDMLVKEDGIINSFITRNINVIISIIIIVVLWFIFILLISVSSLL